MNSDACRPGGPRSAGFDRRHFVRGALLAPLSLPASSFLASEAFSSAGTRDGLEIGEPLELGFDPNFQTVLRKVQDGASNTHGVLVMRHGKLVAELYRAGFDRSIYSLLATRKQFGPTDRHDMRSISKSVVSLLYGILLARGEAPDVDVPVPSLFPDCPDLDDAPRRSIRIRHLLTMTAGLDWTEPSPVRRVSSNDETALVYRPCAYRYVFGRDIVAPPGETFTYSGGLTAVLAEIIARSTKRPLRDVARDDLFAPLGIVDWEWTGNLYGDPLAQAGLRLKPRDLMKIGAMMLAEGRWQERQVVPADWIARSTKPDIFTRPLGGYGFQWWTTTTSWKDRPLPVVAAIGNGGQRLFLVRDLDLAVVMTAGDYNDPAINAPLKKIFDEIVGTVTT